MWLPFPVVSITVNPANPVSPEIPLLGKCILHVVGRIVICRTEGLVTGAQEQDQQQKN